MDVQGRELRESERLGILVRVKDDSARRAGIDVFLIVAHAPQCRGTRVDGLPSPAILFGQRPSGVNDLFVRALIANSPLKMNCDTHMSVPLVLR
jgi:hypothetical protein